MSYLLTGSASVQAVDGAQSFQTLLKYTLSALETDSTIVIPVSIGANTPTTIPLLSISSVQLIAVKSANPIQVSVAAENGTDVYSLASQFQLFIRSDGTSITHLKIKSTVASTVEVVVAGMFS